MVRHLFKGFLFSREEYEGSVAIWRSLLEELAGQAGQSGEWVSWRPTTFADGTPIPSDGNPIFDARSSRLSKAITVMQNQPTSGDVELAAWIADRHFQEPNGQSYTDDLTLSIALSDESLKAARMIIEQWMNPGTSRERMEDLLSDPLGW